MKNSIYGSQLEPINKYRHHLMGPGLYQNVHRGTLRPIGIDYTLPNCTGRRSASNNSSITQYTHHSLWPERHQLRTPISCIGVERKSTTSSSSASSKGKACSIALAIASFIVLIVVLGIAGLALYMGISNTESPTSAIITFSCSAKVIRGDTFLGALEEKAQKYKRQIELLYQKSALGPALFSVIVERFGKDAATIYFKLSFNRRKLVEDLTNIENAIKDIFLSDGYLKSPIFRNVRFDPRSILVRQVQQKFSSSAYSAGSSTTLPSASKVSNIKSSKMGVVLKSSKNLSSTYSSTTMKPFIKEEPEFNEKDLPVIQGSFMISKTEADITEKKTERSDTKVIKTTSSSPISKTTFKESSVTSAVYKFPGVKGKVTKVALSATVPSTAKITKKTTPSSTTPTTTTRTTTTTKTPTTSLNFKGSPQILDDEPWVPIQPNSQGYPNILIDNIPIYTSFTNPGFSYNFQENERLGSTSLKSHPIPVNKISITQSYAEISTESASRKNILIPEITTSSSIKSEVIPNISSFIPLEIMKSNTETRQHYPIQNISSIFAELASSSSPNNNMMMDTANFSSVDFPDVEIKEPSGQGQVEVVDVDVDELFIPTTKMPLVTLLPVRSNSGIGRPFNRNRLGDSNNLSVENRSFPTYLSNKQTLELAKKPKNRTNNNNNNNNNNSKVPNPTNVSTADNFRISSVLNFAKEGIEESESSSGHDIVRFPKMDVEEIEHHHHNRDDGFLHSNNNTVSSSSSATLKPSNLLSQEQIKQLSEISKIKNNKSFNFDEVRYLISNKAISSVPISDSKNSFKVLTKTFEKFSKESVNSQNKTLNHNSFKENYNKDCLEPNFKCIDDGKCIPESTKCNQLIDCSDGSDEQNCNCADYLKSQLLGNKICDGIVDCWDFSDENRCKWCNPDQHVCSNSKICIAKEKICDGMKDCPQGDDERQCVTIADNNLNANDFSYYSQGYLMVRNKGQWGKLCIDNFASTSSVASKIPWAINDLGKEFCKSMTYQKMNEISSDTDNNDEQASSNDQKYFQLSYPGEHNKNQTNSLLLFKESECPSKKVVKVTCESLECGSRPQAVKLIARVVGGGNAGLGSWPWQVALYKEGEFQCGATLLNNRWLISAGHCFYRSLKEHWVARLGALRRGTTLPSPYEQLKVISRIIIHPGYLDFGFINDISLLQMESPVIFSDYVRPVCLPNADNEQKLENGKLCTVVGWGQLFEVGRIFPDTLQEVQIPVISTAECQKRTLFLPLYKITEDMFCAGFDRGGRDACLGDSGGPLMCPESNGRWTLQGITSNGYGCARANRPGVYTKVSNYLDFINFYIIKGSVDDTKMKNITKISTTCNGHRCPLGECLPDSRLCNGFIECSDGSDEKNCKKIYNKA